MKILPVLHYLDTETTIAQVHLARKCGADGIFLIDHNGDDDNLLTVASLVKLTFTGFPVGINLLSRSAAYAARSAKDLGLDMVWADSMGVSSAGLTSSGLQLRDMAAQAPELTFFASVAFKYQPVESDPAEAARQARSAGFVATTSGTQTGVPPSLEKIRQMSEAAGGKLAIASGMTPENIAQYAPFLSHVLVSTGISVDDSHFDELKLKALIRAARDNAQAPLTP
ncbi:BtpA/SgcQ family protein [Hydrogenophaga sp. 2FB]|uniref:BtpA/SgcQ family protein n=1 Tax=Hydrogenophaga sp. 2FB TaxID=2502187 RepID=UPI0010F6CEEE|nr:BtpA/SgcQ family protein [Hydrogenophaga sp. 2FB]